MARHTVLLLLAPCLCLSSALSSFKNFPVVVGLKTAPALPLVEAVQEEEDVREPRQAEINSYSYDNLDDTFIEEAVFLTPEDREEREYKFEEWAEEESEGAVEEAVRPERDGLGGHHGAHHGAQEEHEEQAPAERMVRRRGRKQQATRRQQADPARQEEQRQEPARQEERAGRQTGDVGFAAGPSRGASSPPSANGDYAFNFSNEDGSSRQETSDAAGVSGSYSFFTPEGEEVSIQYVADETGFHATGSHVPQAPPMPPAIRRMLDHLAKVNGHAKLY